MYKRFTYSEDEAYTQTTMQMNYNKWTADFGHGCVITPGTHFATGLLVHTWNLVNILYGIPNSKAYGANMGLTWGRQDYVCPMDLAIWDDIDSNNPIRSLFCQYIDSTVVPGPQLGGAHYFQLKTLLFLVWILS